MASPDDSPLEDDWDWICLAQGVLMERYSLDGPMALALLAQHALQFGADPELAAQEIIATMTR